MELKVAHSYDVFFRFELLVGELKHTAVFLSTILHFELKYSFLLLWLGWFDCFSN